MPEPTPTGAVDVVQRQVRRVRRRKNRYELQRAVFLTIAVGAAAGTVLLPIALFASAAAFGLAAWSALALVTGVALAIAGATRRRWLARRDAVAWIEGRSALDGRLRTLVELAARPAAARGFFAALLAHEVRRDLDAWAPRRMVPRGVPRAALASAVAASVLLMIALRMAAFVVPAPPAIGVASQPIAGRPADRPADVRPGERIVVAPGIPDDAASAPAVDRRGDDSALTQLSSAVQERVRRQVWGEAWERVRDALARAASGEDGAGSDAEGGADDDVIAGDESRLAQAPAEAGTRGRFGAERPAPRQPDDEGSEGDDSDAAPPADARATAAGDGEGHGGGTGIGPDLFGGAPVARRQNDGAFELALAARMRSDAGAGRPGTGPPPDADPDARPALAPDQRREHPAHRLRVPAAYESVVREVFAHRDPR